MTGPRIVFLSRTLADQHGDLVGERLAWMVMSPNSRPLGRSVNWFHDVDECRDDVRHLREHLDDLRVTVAVSTGRWQWRADLDGEPVAVSVRPYLRQHECDYSLRRFLEAFPQASMPSAARAVRNGSADPDALSFGVH